MQDLGGSELKDTTILVRCEPCREGLLNRLLREGELPCTAERTARVMSSTNVRLTDGAVSAVIRCYRCKRWVESAPEDIAACREEDERNGFGRVQPRTEYSLNA